jgi:tetratricopeptide (TPR) repeat protein
MFNAGKEPRWSQRALHAELRQLLGERDHAERLRGEAESTRTDDADDWYLYSLATLDRKLALDRVRRALARDRTHALAWEWRAYLHLAESDRANALICARELVRLNPRDAASRLLLAHFLVKAERFEEAVQRFTEAVELDPEPLELRNAYRYRGQAHLALADFAAALGDLETTRDFQERRNLSVGGWMLRQFVVPTWILQDAREGCEVCKTLREALPNGSFSHAQCVLLWRERCGLGYAEDPLDWVDSRTNDPWLRTVLECLRGRISPFELVAAAESPKQRCEACYYAGEMELAAGNQEIAGDWFQRCLDTRMILDPDSWPPDPMSEYVLARWRLNSPSR